MKRVAVLLGCALACVGADLPQRLAALVESAPPAVRGAAGVHVVNLATGQPVYAYNENQLLLPASNMKLFTAALALTRLGPEHRFQTALVHEPSGALVVLGGGDPSLSGRAYPYDPQPMPLSPLHAIEALVDQAIAAGLTRVDGDVIGDDRRYPYAPYPESWTADDALHEYGAPVSALTLNDNVVTVTVRPGGSAGALARVELDPPFEYFAIDNRMTTSVNGSGGLRIARVPGTRQLVLTGSIDVRASALRETVAVDDPALFAAHAIYDALLRRGIPVRGRPVARHALSGEDAPEGTVLATRESPPLRELLRAATKVSQNLHFELFLREAALRTQGQGTMEAGLRELRALSVELGIPAQSFVSEDGSGLARNDEVAPRAVTQLLTLMDAREHAATWRSLLPVGGQDGTLGARLCCSSETVSIRAKTGSLSRAVALSGYADSPTNGRLAFSILVNNFGAPSAEVRAWVDRLAAALVE